MTTYVYRNGELVEKSQAAPLEYKNDAVQVISDTMDPLRHMADGRYYDSKAKFRQATKDNGCIEVGSDPSIFKPRKPTQLSRSKRVDDIKRAIYELRNRRR